MSIEARLLVALGVFSATYLFLLFRISNFRRDNPDPDNAYLGSPGSSLWEVLDRQTYDERGRHLYPYLIASYAPSVQVFGPPREMLINCRRAGIPQARTLIVQPKAECALWAWRQSSS
jgi:hypothetical protein